MDATSRFRSCPPVPVGNLICGARAPVPGSTSAPVEAAWNRRGRDLAQDGIAAATLASERYRMTVSATAYAGLAREHDGLPSGVRVLPDIWLRRTGVAESRLARNAIARDRVL